MMGYTTHCKQFDMDVSANKGNSTKFMAISNGIIMITNILPLLIHHKSRNLKTLQTACHVRR